MEKLKIGDTFKWLNMTFEVCKSNNGSCKGCYFENDEKRCTAVNYYTVPKCTYKMIFKLIKDGKTKI